MSAEPGQAQATIGAHRGRPVAVTLLFALSAVAAVYMLAFGVILLSSLPSSQFWFAGIILALGCFSLAVFWGIMRAKPWHRRFGLIEVLVLLVLGVFLGGTGALVFGIPFLALGLLVWYLLTRSEVKARLAKSASTP